MKIYKWVEVTALKCTHTELITNRMTFRFKHDHLSNQIVYCHWLLCIRPSTNHFELDKSPCGSNIHRLRYQLILGRSNGSQCDRRSTIRRRRLTTKKLNHHKIHEQSNRIEWNERTKQKKTVREKKPETRAQAHVKGVRMDSCVALLRDFMWLNGCRQFAQFLWFICLHTLEMIVFRWNVCTTKNQFNKRKKPWARPSKHTKIHIYIY